MGAEALGKKPNILFVLVDDQSPLDLRAYSPSSALETPTIDQLAAQGMVFDGAYHMGANNGAVCTPSRHQIMSGRGVWHIPTRTDNPGPDIVPPNLADNTIGAVFNRAGYSTMRTCKAGNSYAAANAQFTINQEQTSRKGTDANGSAWHAERVLDYLDQREQTADDKPFLIYLGFSHPHDERDGKPELLAKYGATNHTSQVTLPTPTDAAPPLPSNWLPAHPFPHGHLNLRDEVAVSGVWEKRDPQTMRNEKGREFACSENVDIQIGRVLERLRQSGELENTYVIYTSDHGIAVGRHGLQGKQNLYEHTWRVPFIVSGPGILPGRAPGNIYLADVLSTLCHLAGIEPPDTNEGISFLPVLDRSTDKVRDVLFGVYAGGTKPGIRSVRQGDWKLIKYDVLDGSVRETQLFNLAENPNEYLAEHHAASVVAATGVQPEPHQVDLAEDPQWAAKRAEMEALLLSEMQERDDPHPLWDQ